ncbi:MAG: hypothetical protein Q8J88_00580 [Bacteroidales bacterium]|nr:hypothetical protein [Bacteroidales bacterium]
MNKLSEYNSFFAEIIKTTNSARYQAFKSLNKFHIGQHSNIIKENELVENLVGKESFLTADDEKSCLLSQKFN